MNRYYRHTIMPEIGLAGQVRLGAAKVLVIGAGGLGCPVLQYLTAAGVGTIGIVDFDTVDESNLQRQILYGMADIGQNKALTAKKRLQMLNPSINIHAYPEKLSPKNALEWFRAYDIIVDGSDNFATRYLVNDACLLTDKPLVYGAIYKFEGQVAVFNYQGGPCYRCLFPQIPKPENAPSCAEIGVLGVLPGIIGSYQANEVIKLILGIGKPLSGELFLYHALNNSHHTIRIPTNQTLIAQIKALGLQNSYEEVCASDHQIGLEIEASDIDFNKAIQWIDIRAPHELPKVTSIVVNEWPMQEVKNKLASLSALQPIILFCQSGQRSLKMAKELQALGYQAQSLKGGVFALLNEELKLHSNTS